MTSPQNHIAKFQQLLRELFQFDCAELDFGIYRIMNHKRDILEKFINETLPNLVDTDLKQGILFQQDQANKVWDESRESVIKSLGRDAVDSVGELAEAYQVTPVGEAYLDAKAAASSGRSRSAVERDIYNHLYAFFSRYYQEGDFISKRRYSRNHRYAIPYHGEEVHLHWANNDQYYIKTAEYFHNYDWKAPNGVAVHFRLKAADVEQNNVKGEKRFFLPLIAQVKWDPNPRELTIPFEYRPLTMQEKSDYGTRNHQQDKIITAALEAISEQLGNALDALAALMAEKSQNSNGEPITFLEHHLRQYTRRNTSDFFIHKDLKGFLSRELDFYLKNEVLNLDEIAVTGEDRLKGWFQMMQLIQSIGSQIIDFLDQIEEFQKMLWEKRKFITQTHHCIALGNIKESFYTDIATCEAQWTEWKALFSIDENETDLFNSGKNKTDKRVAFLKTHPTLVLDTKHFDRNFIDRLLASFDDLDGMTDGILIHSENYQALNLLQEKYQECVNCIYIDPLYNTGEDGFLYKDNYQHSTWLSMMDNLILSWRSLLLDSGFLVSHIDEHEFNALDRLFDMRFGAQQNIGPIIWDKRNPKGDATAIASQHEYICWAVKDYSTLKGDKQRLRRKKENGQAILRKANELMRLHGGVTEKTKSEFKKWVNRQKNFSGGEKAYCELDKNGLVYRPVSMAWPNRDPAPAEYFRPLIHPVENKPCPVPARGWRNPPDTMKELLEKDLILFGADASTQPTRKYLLIENATENVPSLYYFGGSDDSLQKAIGYHFSSAKPVRLGEYVISISTSKSDSIVLDSFAGSGTTGHAVINLNREDGGQRKFILVEMGEYFDTVLLPRIKKITFTPEWRNGKPNRMATPEEADRSPRMIKYIRLESYEDALDNIEFDNTTEQLRLHEKIDDHLIKYMLKWETKHSSTLLNLEKLNSPFTYRLRVHANGETREQIADVPETFNQLLGLNVRTRKVYEDDGRYYLVYRGNTREAPGQEVAIIWRETEGWTPDDFERDRRFVAEQKITRDADVVYVNGDSCILHAKAVEPIFKTRMFASVT